MLGIQVLPLDSMCGSVKKSVTDAYKQHLSVKHLAETAEKQVEEWPTTDASVTLIGSVGITAGGQAPQNRSMSLSSDRLESFARPLPDSDSSSEGPPPVQTLAPRWHTRRGRGMRSSSMPRHSHKSSQDLLSADLGRISSTAEIRLDVQP